jgi:hypothetical protein
MENNNSADTNDARVKTTAETVEYITQLLANNEGVMNSAQNIIETLNAELAFMYIKYEQLCAAYKKLAQESGSPEASTAHDMSHMSFVETNKEEM